MAGQRQRLLVIAGPCMLESRELVREVARTLKDLAPRFPQLDFVLKGSFDKANRSSGQSPRGPGLQDGLAWLAEAGAEAGLPVTTDIHLPEQAGPAGEVCDVLQIPAFLCRQTDLLAAAAATGRTVNVKKGQFVSPMEMTYVVRKLHEAKATNIWLTERGTTFGYQNLVVDMRSFAMMSPLADRIIFDATHSVQLPGAGDGVTNGQREFVLPLARAALAAGATGLFLETHPDPAQALSDSACQWPLAELAALLDACQRVWEATGGAGS